MVATLRVLSSVFKLRIGVFCALAAIAGALATKGVLPDAGQIAAVAMAVLISAAAAGVLPVNQSTAGYAGFPPQGDAVFARR